MKDMFQDTIERLFSDMVTTRLIVDAENGVWPAALWATVEDNGLTLAASPEELGGVGGSWHDAFVLVRAAGRHCAPIPLSETLLVNWLLGLAGIEAIGGPATLADHTDGRFDGTVFSGTLDDVPWGSKAAHVLVVTGGQAPTILLLPCAAAKKSPGMNIAREPRDTLVFDGVVPVAHAAAPVDWPVDIVRLGGAMIRSAQIAGALQRLLETAIDYANQRVQFGRPIGKFQAIQHQIAILAEQTSMAACAAEAAFATATRRPSFLATASAKTVSSDAAGQGAAIAHAVLGAIGFTYEHSLHLSTRRLWSWRSEFGSQTFWSQRIGEAACGASASGYWPYLTTGTVADI